MSGPRDTGTFRRDLADSRVTPPRSLGRRVFSKNAEVLTSEGVSLSVLTWRCKRRADKRKPKAGAG